MTESMDVSTEEIRQRLANMNIQLVDGVKYGTDPRVCDVATQLERIRHAKIHESDVITVGFPRSGNHWAYEIVNMVVHQTTDFAEGPFYGALLEDMGENIHETLHKMGSPRVLTTHNRMHRLPLQAVDKKSKIIYLLRNPKDVLVSFYTFITKFKVESMVFRGTWEEFFLLQMSGDFPWGSWFDHVLATEKFMTDHQDCPVYIHVFDEIKRDPVTKIRQLSSFLGQPETLAEQIAAVTEFRNMKTKLTQGKMAGLIQKEFKDDDTLFRKGSVGDWRNWFTVTQNEFFNRIFEEKMAGSKLGDLIRPYI